MMTTYEDYGSEENEGGILRDTLPSPFTPDDYILPGQKLQRLPVISSVISPSSPRAIIPELQVIASEIQVLDGQIHLGPKTSKELSERILSEVHHFEEMKEIFDHRKEEGVKFHKPALASLVIEQDLQKDLEPVPPNLSFVQSIIPKYNHQSEIRKLKKTISQTKTEDGMNFVYVHAKDDLYPRKFHGSGGRIKLIPMFQFPECVTNFDEITWKETRMVLSKDLSRDILNHCVLQIDHNDYLLNDWRNFADLPTDDQSLGVTGFDLVKNHLLNGRWVWITKESDVCRRSIMVEQTAHLYDARMMFIFSKHTEEMPYRPEPLKIFTTSSDRIWGCWERMNYGGDIPLLGGVLICWVYSEGYNEGEGGPLAWINHADNNDLAKFLRPENHSRHNHRAVITLGKRSDRTPPVPKFLRQDSGYCTMEPLDILGELDSELLVQVRPNPIDESSKIRYVSHLNHLPWCDEYGTPGFHCDCPGPSREEGQEFREDEEEDEEAFCRRRRKFLDLPEPNPKPGFKKRFSKPSFSNNALKTWKGKLARLGKSKDVSHCTSRPTSIHCVN
ncbi:91a05cac-6ea2-45d5-8c0a-61e51dba9d28-CDS [Sclerotinia trifoliorum]|uniref:91a05cac-6ea2-45d5-8c0a-61e51dba9d28-CDS n=1 Tax=Sclerotinia trifoliorum TaxID=28548 RepID=A0A8H2ZK50_9HELO|nr:91a05cac-6ea2-45d5-8c0a-61e51dba9d28-CDS [Sclerotinia trifoliorum]